MVYVPIQITKSEFDSILFRNIYRLVDEYKVSNSYITVQDREKDVSYPAYVIYIPETTKKRQTTTRTDSWIPVSIQIDFDALPGEGDWQKTAEMHNTLEAGIESEEDNLRTAKIRFVGSEVVSAEALEINQQQIFSRSVVFDFVVLL